MGKKWLVSVAAAALSIPMTMALSSFGTVRADEAQDGSVAINEKNFPDEEFRKVVSGFDQDGDKMLSSDEIKAVEEINVSEMPIQDLTGLQFFSELKNLYCEDTKISSIDVSKNTNLVEFFCRGNGLKKVDVSNNPMLEYFWCGGNSLTSLDLSNNPLLENFWCDGNSLTSLDLSNNPELRVLGCDDNRLRELDLSKNPELIGFGCEGNALAELDLSHNLALRNFHCARNELKTLDLSFLEWLTQATVSENPLTELKLGRHQFLDTLFLNETDLNEVDVRRCPTLLDMFEKYGIHEDEFYNCYVCAIPIGDDGVDVKKNRSSGYDYDRATGRKIKCADMYWSQIMFLIDYETNLIGYELPEIPGHPRKPVEGRSFEDFVEHLYWEALDRAPDPEGMQYWVKQVEEEGKTGADCARFFLLDSPEFMERYIHPEDFVEKLYGTIFDREPDEEGKKNWVMKLASGLKSRRDVVNDFIESTEWCDVCASYGVKSGAKWHKATKASKKSIDFATRLYSCCLKRDPEADGVEYWSLALTNLEQTGASAAQFFFEGEEFMGFNTTINDYLKRLYTTFMDREPAASEIEYWIGEIKAGRQNRHSILVFFSQSPEFTSICKKYGIDRGEIE